MKTKNKIILAGLFLMTAMISCDTDRLPETAIADASYWRSESDLKMAANYLYTSLPGPGLSADLMSDNAFGTVSNSISDGSRITPATDNDYNNNYKFIRAANKLIENAPKVLANGIAETTVNWYVGEAKYFRARAYYNLLQRYGGVPLILKVLNENSPELQAPQNTRDEVVDAIYADLDDAVSKLRAASVLSSTANASYGRISQTAALALKAEVALFEGTRSKFHGYGNPIKHLTIARDAAKAVMQSGEHKLYDGSGTSSYFNLLQIAGEGPGNKENILVRQYGKSIADVVATHNTCAEIDNGKYGQTQSLVDDYLMKDGLPYTKSPLYVAPNPTTTLAKDLYTNRDPRMSDRFFKAGDPYINSNAFITFGAFIKGKYQYRGYFSAADRSADKSFTDASITRYDEILLIYAEATFELNGTITDADLDASINLLRQRPGVGMPKLTNAFVTTNGLDMRTEIRRERRVELALEGFRYWDLIRWKTAEIELPKTVLGSYWYKEFGTAPTLDSNRYIILHDKTKRTFNPARDYLWPFPTNELGQNPNLKQNPNW